MTMKTTFARSTLLAFLFATTGAVAAFAASTEITITGEAKCAKCAMGQGDTCQTVIEVMKDGNAELYYLAANDTAAAFHKNVCRAPAKATATGTVEKKDGKMLLTVTKVDLVK